MKIATVYQRANFVVSIGCPRKWEICNDDGRTAPACALTYLTAR